MERFKSLQSFKERYRQGLRGKPSSSMETNGREEKGHVLRKATFLVIAFLILTIGIPSLVIWLTDQETTPIELDIDPEGFMVQLHRSKENQVVELPLEQYIRGVIAAEMPAEFHLEALKAQSLAARTYFINKWSQSNQPISDDYRIDQAYLSDQELKIRWGASYTDYSNKINQALNETKGLILTYEKKPIEAYFFSTSNGYTENSEDVWSKATPYLRSVESTGDVISPKFQDSKVIPIQTVHQKLGLAIPVSSWNQGQPPKMQAVKRSHGNRIKELQIGDQTFTGREVREKLGLNSTHFTVSIQGKDMHFTTYGYGHGVGMSQWGAEALAREGNAAEEIVKHYYQGVTIEPYTQVSMLWPKLQETLAKKQGTEQPMP
ncbi:stage II sporulation protein D [Desulfuribacillus stibiiarsenatis]|uniref:Stage II sporulation protein D n=1 Tax=Desulfuribacillus stibiiarsenatis TaxID=1390249 RepID=A0A1E5L5Q1_9FIRM|nr:stage II sporulation protein D [Desulfuribacillus stibiiarsenatis]OEH85455.1 stage II sporulation protein D [Desulfuribacillus stibiiarsenatis]